MYYYCYNCWSDLEEDFKQCPRCGKELSAFSTLNFHDKLIHALDHPERLTLQRVIWIIGNLKIERALPKLSDIAEESDNFVILFEIINTLFKLGSPDAIRLIERLSTHSSDIVRKYAAEALSKIQYKNP